jgi:hypothetical protein
VNGPNDPAWVAAVVARMEAGRVEGKGEEFPWEWLDEPLPMKPETDAHYTRWGRWVENVCLAFGATFETAAQVAALFVQGVRRKP